MVLWLLAAIFLVAPLTSNVDVLAAHNITVLNNCEETLWPAILSTVSPNTSLGYEAPPRSSRSFIVPSAWIGSIWARQSCDFSSNVSGNCSIGGCDALNCTRPGSGGFTIGDLVMNSNNSFGNTSGHFLVSLLQGFNVPMMISASTPCKTVSCPVNLNEFCPLELRTVNSTGATVACSSACTAGIGNTAQNCCDSPYNTTSDCATGNIDFYSYFHDNCPESPATPFEAATNNPSNAACADNPFADFKITLCPATHLTPLPPQVSSIAAPTTTAGNTTSTDGASSSSAPPVSHSGLTGGDIAGIGVGAILLAGLLEFGIFFVHSRRAAGNGPRRGFTSAGVSSYDHRVNSEGTQEKPRREQPVGLYAFSGSRPSKGDESGSSSVDGELDQIIQGRAFERAKQFVAGRADPPS